MQVSRKTQWWMIGVGYAAITAFAARMLYVRHQDMLHDPVIASSGMYAFGDALMVVFLFLLYMFPTFFTLRLLAAHARGYDRYALALLAFSATAPLALGLTIVNTKMKTQVLEDPALVRLMLSPMVLISFVASRWAAQSSVAKRFTNYAVLGELATLMAMVALFFVK